MKKNSRVVPKQNYIYLLLMIVIVVAITFAIFGLNNNYNNKKLETSYLSKYVNEIRVNELESVVSEPSTELFIFITKNNDEKIYKLEKSLKKIITKHELRDNFLLLTYYDETDLNELNKILKSDVKSVPAIVYIKNGEFIKSIDSKDNILRSDEFEKLLDEYEVE